MSRRTGLIALGCVVALAVAAWFLLTPIVPPRNTPARVAEKPTKPDVPARTASSNAEKPSRNGRLLAVGEPIAPVAATASVAGVLVDGDGVPVAGGSVVVARTDRDAKLLSTGADGTFSAADLVAGTWTIAGSKAGLASPRVELVLAPGAKIEGLELRLEAAASLSVTVRDAADGNSISDCQAGPAGGAAIHCDHAGRVRLSPLTAGPLKLRVTAAGFAPRELDVSVAPRASLKVEVSLSRGAVVVGLVRDPDGRVVPGADVWTKHYAINASNAVETRAKADGKGRFELTAVDPGRLTVRAQAEGYAEATSEELRLGPGERTKDLTLTLTTGGAIAGTVSRLGGEPAIGASVRALRLTDRSVAASDTTAPDGSFRLDGLLAGDYTVVAEAEGARALAPGVGVTAREETQVTLLLGDDVVEGTVVDEGGTPIAGALVSAWSAFAGGQGEATAATGTDGTFRLGGLVGAPFRLEARVTGRATGEARGVQPGTPVRIVVGSSGRIEGEVLDDTGRGLDDFVLTLVPSDSSPTGSIASRYKVLRLLSPDGTFAVDGLAAGRYLVRASAAGHRSATQDADVGPRPARVTLKLERGLLVAGRVLQGDKPMVGCEVQESRRDPVFARADEALTSGRTDAQGGFRIAGLSPGRVALWTACPGNLSAWAELDLRADKLDLVLRVAKTPHSIGDDFGGIGATMMLREARVFIASVAEGGPAFLAGLASGDEVVAVDGWAVTGQELKAVIDRIRGPMGTPVALDAKRGSVAFRAVAERARIATN